MAELGVGAVFAGHRIEKVAGRGGMGVVYKATHLALEVVVALKVIAPEFAQDSGFRERFKRESRVAASIEHPQVVAVRDAGEEDGLLYITMRYIDGTDLRTMIEQRGHLDPDVAAGIVAQVGSALDAAHARGLVHRDVKPGNVMIEAGRGGSPNAFLGDFGLTRQAVTQGSGLTKTGTWVGTLDYVAPEQIEGKQIDARADIYALGCVLCEALTGSVPYPRDSDVATMYAHLNEPPPAVRERVPELPPQFDAVVERAMAKDPADRYPSAGDLGRAAVAAAEGRLSVQSEQSVATGKAAGGEGAPAAGETVISAPEVKVASAPTAGKASDPSATKSGAAPARSERAGSGSLLARITGLLPRGRPLLIGFAVAVAAAALIVALVALGGGKKPRDYTAEGRRLLTRFEGAFGSEDLAGLKAVLAPDAQYDYLADAPQPAEKEYRSTFNTLDVVGYSLNVTSIRAAGGRVTANAEYRYRAKNFSCGVQTGTVEMTQEASNAGDGPLRITNVKAFPDIYECIDVNGAPDYGTYTLRVGGAGGPVVARVVKTVAENGKNVEIRLPLNDTGRRVVRTGDRLSLINTGHQSSGPPRYRVVYHPATPFGS